MCFLEVDRVKERKSLSVCVRFEREIKKTVCVCVRVCVCVCVCACVCVLLERERSRKKSVDVRDCDA